jgi:hypothetical protein
VFDIYIFFQVSPNSVRLLTGCELLQQLPIEFGSPVAQASCADPHIVITTQVTEMTKPFRKSSFSDLVH